MASGRCTCGRCRATRKSLFHGGIIWLVRKRSGSLAGPAQWIEIGASGTCPSCRDELRADGTVGKAQPALL